uniref:Reverse transcriptase zinc-binding domain-containing protein n=1 Tax=Cajanus cajan TaxID=3821 RepID=A0A151QTR8_CAJCA|nr:hypothetical protein KK1_045404 [Cajanus cajan]
MYRYLWSKLIPSKVSSFGWRVILDRIPTKQNLIKRKVLPSNVASCVWCGLCEETSSHLFFEFPNCNIVNRVRWSSIWLVTLWSIWLARNEAVFSQKFMDPEEVVDLIKLRSWNWLRAKDSAFQYPFALWSNNPFSCLNFS